MRQVLCSFLLAVLAACGGGDTAPAIIDEPIIPVTTPANSLILSGPRGIAVDAAGNLDVSDTGNSRVVRIEAGGSFTTRTFPDFKRPFQLARNAAGPLAGVGTCGTIYLETAPSQSTQTGYLPVNAYGSAVCGRTSTPLDVYDVENAAVAIDAARVIYAADTRNHVVRKFVPGADLGGVVLAGKDTDAVGSGFVFNPGFANGQGAQARFANPAGIALDASGNIYVADTGNHVIRKVTQAGMVITLAGTAGVPGSANGPAASSSFNRPTGIAVGADGSVYVSDSLNHILRKISTAGVVTTHAGAASAAGKQDGCAESARFSTPTAMAIDALGNLYVIDYGNALVRKVSVSGAVSTVAGGPAGHACTRG